MGSVYERPSVAFMIANVTLEVATLDQSIDPCQWETSIPANIPGGVARADPGTDANVEARAIRSAMRARCVRTTSASAPRPPRLRSSALSCADPSASVAAPARGRAGGSWLDQRKPFAHHGDERRHRPT